MLRRRVALSHRTRAARVLRLRPPWVRRMTWTPRGNESRGAAWGGLSREQRDATSEQSPRKSIVQGPEDVLPDNGDRAVMLSLGRRWFSPRGVSESRRSASAVRASLVQSSPPHDPLFRGFGHEPPLE